MNPREKYRIAIIEPSALVQEGLKSMLGGNPEFEVSACVNEPGYLHEHLWRVRPDVLLVNPSVVDFSKRSHIRTALGIGSEVPVVALLYQYIDEDYLKQFDGSIDICDDHARLFRKLRHVLGSGRTPAEGTGGYDLTDREKEILVSVARGKTNKEIAGDRHISVHTVISHRKNISRKTGIRSVSGLTVYALLNNLIDQSEVE